MTMDSSNPVRLDKTQVKRAAHVLARAFQDDPLCVYFFPEVSERRNRLPHLFRVPVHHGVLYGEVYATSPNLEGVAVWVPSEKADMSLLPIVRSGGLSMAFRMGKGGSARAMRCTAYASAVRKRHAPFRHRYLESIGVAPEFQGKGYAGALLKPMFARMDAERLPCYLETQNEKNVPLYERYGFQVVEEGRIPTTELSNWAMLRQKSGCDGD